MKFWKKNDGLTLVELMVSIAIGTMIFAAATTVLLLGIRINHHTTDSIMQQYTARTVITMMEQMAEEGSVNKTYRASDGSWKLGTKLPDDEGQDEYESVFKKIILSYSSVNQTIYTGDLETPILENVVASYIVMEGNVLTVSLEDTEGTYSSSVYCRIEGVTGGKNFASSDHGGNIIKEPDPNVGRSQLLLILNSQAGVRGGLINQKEHEGFVGNAFCSLTCQSFNFFSEWFVGGYEGHPTWNTETPWCAIFVSWGLCHVENLTPQGINGRWYENVDHFMAYFTDDPEKKTAWWKPAGSEPVPGDLVFFDMVGGTTDNPSHMGVVLSVSDDGKKVTTIEGNSADMVAVREYELNDPRILGYGDPWAAQAN